MKISPGISVSRLFVTQLGALVIRIAPHTKAPADNSTHAFLERLRRDKKQETQDRFPINGAAFRLFCFAEVQRKCWIGILVLLLMGGPTEATAAPDPWQVAAEFNNAEKFKEAADAYSKLIRKNPKEERGYMGRGHALWRMKDFKGALADYERAVALNPKDPEAFNRRGLAHDDNGQRELAMRDFDRAIEMNPNNAIFHHNRASLWGIMNQLDKACEDYQKTLELNPKYAPSYINRGILLSRFGYYEKAIADYSMAIAINGRDAKPYINRALAYDCLGQDKNVLADFHKALELDPKSTVTYNNLGFYLASRAEYDQALANFSKAVQLAPNVSMYYNNRGNAWLGKGDMNRAMEDFDKAIALDPKSAKAFRNRAAAWLIQGQFNKALADATESIEISRDEAKSYRIRGNARDVLGDAKGAKQDADWALILGPQPRLGDAVAVPPDMMAREKAALRALLEEDSLETRVQLAAVRHEHAVTILGKPQIKPGQQALEEAAAYARSATVLEPSNAEHWFLTGMLFHELTEKDPRAAAMAEQALRHAVKTDPEHASSWLEFGLLLADQKRGREAMTALEKALENNPARTAPKAAGLLCAMYALNDEGFRGVAFFQQLYEGNPEVSALGVGLAIMLNDRGDREAAIEQARDIMLIEDAGTVEYIYASKLVNEWIKGKP